jgi:hypothetical protein
MNTNNCLNWIKNNQYEVIIALYLITLYISHHTFSPNLYWFRNITSLLLFRVAFLILVLYALYHLYTKRLSLTSRFGKLCALLVISLLLTEYHAHGSWEMFENGKNVSVFIKKSGENLFLTISGDTATLSQGASGDLSSQIWTLSPGIGNNITLGSSGDKYLTSDFTIKSSIDIPQWTLETVSNDDIDSTIRKTDESQVENLTGPDQKPCESKDITYVRLKTSGGYLTNVDGQLKLQEKDTDSSPSTIWYLFKCFPSVTTTSNTSDTSTNSTTSDTTSDTTANTTDNTDASNTSDESNTSDNKTVKTSETFEGYQNSIESSQNMTNVLDAKEMKLSKHFLDLQMPNLNSLLNQFNTDSPDGKAYTSCTDSICGFDFNDRFQTV